MTGTAQPTSVDFRARLWGWSPQDGAQINARTGRALVGIAVAVVVGVALVLVADRDTLRGVGESLAGRPWPLVAALAAYTAGFVLRAAAWGPLLPGAVSLGRRVRAIFAMLAVNHALPGPVGEVARARAVSGPDLPLRRALVSVAAARVVDVGAVAGLVLVAALAAGESPTWVRVAAPLALVLPALAWAVARRRGRDLDRRTAVRVAALAVPSWALEAGVLMAVAAAAGLDISPAAALLATCAGLLAQVAAVLPGGIGTYEAGVTSALIAVGVPAGEALAVATTTHGVKFAYAFAVGVPALLTPAAGGRR